MKGIVLAGGKGTRLYPMTTTVSKQLLPVYDKPMIYYPLSILLLAKIKEILIISTPRDIMQYQELLGNGERFGVRFEYKIQEKPRGLADAFILGEEFIGKDSVCLILGDNIFYGQGITDLMIAAQKVKKGATIFGYPVNNPEEFGVVEFDENFKVVSLEEKPKEPKSRYVVPGLYFYDNEVIEIAKNVKPSPRGEIEITAINNEYFSRGMLNVQLMRRGMAWLDTGSPSNLIAAAQFIETIQNRQSFYVACLEEIAWRNEFINDTKLQELGEELKQTEYGKYILNLLKEKEIDKKVGKK